MIVEDVHEVLIQNAKGCSFILDILPIKNQVCIRLGYLLDAKLLDICNGSAKQVEACANWVAQLRCGSQRVRPIRHVSQGVELLYLVDSFLD